LLDGHFSPDSFRRNMTALSPGISHEKAWSLAFDHDNRDRTGEAGRGFAVGCFAVVARSIAGTAEAADNANRSAGLVLATTHELSDQAGQLRLSVDRFLSNVAA
jgi:hypothetical protein